MESRIVAGSLDKRARHPERGGALRSFEGNREGRGFRIERVELVRNRSPIRAVITIRTKLCRPGSGGDVSSI